MLLRLNSDMASSNETLQTKLVKLFTAHPHHSHENLSCHSLLAGMDVHLEKAPILKFVVDDEDTDAEGRRRGVPTLLEVSLATGGLMMIVGAACNSISMHASAGFLGSSNN